MSKINNYQQWHVLDDIYSTHPIQQSTDKQTNQTSYVINYQKAYQRSQYVEIDVLNDVRCKYCKGYYFPQSENKGTIKDGNANITKTNRLKNIDNHVSKQNNRKQQTCGLCWSINEQKSGNQVSSLPQFSQNSQTHDNQPYFHNEFNSNFQSLLMHAKQQITSNPTAKTQTPHLQKSDHSITFLFFIDLQSLHYPTSHHIVSYVQTVVHQYFISYLQQITSQQEQDQRQQYFVMICLNIGQKIFCVDLSRLQTICVDSLVREKFVETVAKEQNVQDIKMKEGQRKNNLLKLFKNCSIQLNSAQNIAKIDQFLETLLQQLNQTKNSNSCSLFIFSLYNQLMQLIVSDHSISYISILLSTCPILNHQPHSIRRSNIYTILYLFYEPSSSNDTKQNRLPQIQFSQSTIKNQIAVIKDNSEIHFIQSSQQGLTEFYYRLYENVSAIVSSIKIFNPIFQLKSDSKYPPVMTNQFPYFFINQNNILMLINSCLYEGGHTKFQMSILYENYKRQRYLWLINWTKDQKKEQNELSMYPKQSLKRPLASILPQVYNYMYILSKFSLVSCSQQSKTPQPINTNKLVIIIEALINQGKFMTGNLTIEVEYLERLYDYFFAMKNASYEVLKFLSLAKYNIRRGIYMIWPLIAQINPILSEENQEETLETTQNLSYVTYWSQGFTIYKNQTDSQLKESDWQQQFVSTLNQYQFKFFTREYIYRPVSQIQKTKSLQKCLAPQVSIPLFYVDKLQQNLAMLQRQQIEQRNPQQFEKSEIMHSYLIRTKLGMNFKDIQNFINKNQSNFNIFIFNQPIFIDKKAIKDQQTIMF